MKRRYIFLNQLLISYFLTQQQTEVTYKELTNWAEFLSTKLSTEDKIFITDFTRDDIKSAKTSVLKCVYKFNRNGVSLKIDLNQLKCESLNYTSKEIAEGILNVCDSFKTYKSAQEELCK